ncbi:hypothetical protein D4S03_06720 [bacterium]|nr:MAG: hypothetical protein D4S03_06720 [bacterium]
MKYRIKIRAVLDPSWSQWLGGLDLSSVEEDGVWITTLVVETPDSPALFGILDRIRDMNLTLVSVNQVNE